MATVFKKANSRFWYAQYYEAGTGKRVAKSTGKEKRREAEKVAEDFESDDRKRADGTGLSKPLAVLLETAAREASAGALTPAKAEEILTRIRRAADPNFRVVSFDAHFSKWIEDQVSHVGVSTIESYRQAHSKVIEAVGKRTASRPVGELTESELRAAMQKIKAGGLKGSSVNVYLQITRRVLHKAVSEGIASVNVASGIRKLPETDSVERAPFTAEEVKLLMASASTEWRGVILFAAHTGLRLMDVVSLGRHHIEGSRLVIRPSKTARRKKTITVPLSPECVEWIDKKKGAFFPALALKSKGTLSAAFSRIMKRAGIPKGVILPGGIVAERTFHSLRHTFTSWLADADVHPDVRRKLTGHASSAMHDRYTHHDEALDRAISSLPSLQAPQKP